MTGVSHASDAVLPGDLYVARGGQRAHGADFSAAAVRAGAVAVLTDTDGVARMGDVTVPVVVVRDPRAVLGSLSSWIYGEPSRAMTLLGVTGTAGKTTTTYLLDAALQSAGVVSGLLGSVETRIAGESVPSVHTTPEAPELQGILAAMRDHGVTAVAIEVSSHALAQGRVDGTRFAAAGFLNLSQDHLDFHTDMEDYFAAKARLFDGRSQVGVVNLDDPWGRRLVGPETITVSAAGVATARWRAEEVAAAEGVGVNFTAVGPGDRRLPVELPLPGLHNVGNALLGLAMLDASLDLDLGAAAAGMRTTNVPGRLEPVHAGQSFLAYVDYAHKPGAISAVLQALRPATRRSLIIVLGCGGDRDRGKRPLMGEAAALGADLVVITDDNPRSEDPAAIRAGLEAGVRAVSGAQWVVIPDRRDAIASAVGRAGVGDTIVVAGKGHEQGQEIAGGVHPFDDRVVLREAIEAARR